MYTTQWNTVVPLAFIPPHLARKWKYEMKSPKWYTVLPKILSAALIYVKGRKKNKQNWLNCRILENLILFKISSHLNWLFSSLISLFGICFIMLLIFYVRIGSIKKQCCFAWLMNFACLYIFLLILCFFSP